MPEKNRRQLIKSLGSARTALLKQRDLSMKGRATTAENQVQEQERELEPPTRVSVYERYVR